MVQLKVPDVPLKKNFSSPHKRTPLWYKADMEDRAIYKEILHEKLSNVSVPEDLDCTNIFCTDEKHSLLRDEFVLSILCTFIETSYECVPLSTKKYLKKVGKSPQLIPKWDYVIKPLKEDLLFWHSVWLSAGHPSQGVLR